MKILPINIVTFVLLLRTKVVLSRALPALLKIEDYWNGSSSKLNGVKDSLLQSGCLDPGIPIHGHRILLVNLQPKKILGDKYFPIGAKLRYGCAADYRLRGRSAVLKCEWGRNKRAHWDSWAPQCVGESLVVLCWHQQLILQSSMA